MKRTTLLATILAASMVSQAWAEAPKMKMQTEIPPGIVTPDKLETSLGTLTAFDGVPDKGKGGKFLILPPGYEGNVPEGYHVAKSPTHGNWVIWRGFQVDGSPKPAVDATKKLFRMYPLSKQANPPQMNFVNISGQFDNTIHRMDYGYWEEVNATIFYDTGEKWFGRNYSMLNMHTLVNGEK